MNTKKILILEDEVLVATDLAELLASHGYQTALAHSFEQALEVSKQFKPHLALCDIHLGADQTGIDFAAKLLQNNPGAEVIYVTAFSRPEDLEAASHTTPLNYIVKPWNEQQMLTTVALAFQLIAARSQKKDQLSVLSLAEYRVVELVAKQLSSKEIAGMLNLSEKTVRNHRYNIIKKLNLPNDNNSLLKWASLHLR